MNNKLNKRPCSDFVGSNPIIRDVYTADPAPMAAGDTLYLYTTHDEDELINGFYTMLDWKCYSTKDMVNWTDHGTVFSLKDISWADDRAWAPQCVERNGKYYLYCPVHKKNGGMAIAVGVADTPAGPFTDLGEPLVDEGDWNDIDPTVFIDEDNQAYLYFGNPELRYVLLNEDMVSYDKEVGVVKIPMTFESFGKGSHMTGTTYGEGPWFYRRGDLYYMVYAAFAEGAKNEHLAYSTSESPTGPWEYGGVLMTEEGGVFTNHPGVVDFKGRSYLFYHTGQLEGGSLFHRSVCIAEFEYNDDGSIDAIAKCGGVNAVEYINPFEKVSAATASFTSGVKKQLADDGSVSCCNISDGGYIKLCAVNFGSGADRFTANIQSEFGGQIEIRLDSLDGELAGTLDIPESGEFISVCTDIGAIKGAHDLYLIFNCDDDEALIKLSGWSFGGKGGGGYALAEKKPINKGLLIALGAAAAAVVTAVVISKKKKKNKKK